MCWKKIVAGFLVIIGVVSMSTSFYITKQVEEGKVKMQSAEKQIKKGGEVFSLIPEAKPLEEGLKNSVNKKIEEGKDLIAHYENLAQNLKTGGIVLVVLGGVFFFIPKKRTKK